MDMCGSAPFVLAVLLGCSGCAALPTVTFDPSADGGASADGGGGDDATVSADGGPTGAGDGAIAVVPDAGSVADAQPTTCPGVPPPPGIDACCGATACIDRQNQGNCQQCGDCLGKGCALGEVCCYAPHGNLSCKKNAADCH